MKRHFVILSSALLFALASAAGAAEKADFGSATRAPYSPPPAKSINGKSIGEMKKKVQELWSTIDFEKGGKKVQYVVTLATDAGNIQVEFWPDVAPNHARAFIALSQAGFYDGLIFHRCIPGFVIQGGCPKGDGTGGPGYCLKPEFNKKAHVEGVLSMARAQPNDSAGSQFFICTGNAGFLDNKYTAFGKVTAGMDVVQKIVSARRDASDRPLKPVTIKKATVAVKK